MELIAAVVGCALAAALSHLLWRCSRRLKELTAQYSGIIDVDSELELRRRSVQALDETVRRNEAEQQQRRTNLESEYQNALSQHNALQKELSLLEENRDDISFGLYKPHYRFDTSEDYKNAADRARNQQRALTKKGEAAQCETEWTVRGSKEEGARMQKQYLKLMLRAFNGECDAAVANVSWNNVGKMEERIRLAHSRQLTTLGK